MRVVCLIYLMTYNPYYSSILYLKKELIKMFSMREFFLLKDKTDSSS